MKKKWIIYPERDIYGDGRTVAVKYLQELQYPICIIRSYSKYYRVEVFNREKSIYYIPYDIVELERLQRKLKKKIKKRQISEEQSTKIILLMICDMVDQNYIL